jgi:orotidine-5'-phosphate decarboxylase
MLERAVPVADDRLIVALDVPTAEAARSIVSGLGDTVSFYKVGHELLFGGGLELARALKDDGKRVFLDMKLLDIANTMEKSVANAARMGVDFLTIHGHDRASVRAAAAGKSGSGLKVLAVTVLTSLSAADVAEQGFAMTPAQLVVHRARMAFDAGADGVIASGQEAAAIRAATGPGFLIVTPGIRPAGAAAGDQARVMTPREAIAGGANHIVVGRPITAAADPGRAAQAILNELAGA